MVSLHKKRRVCLFKHGILKSNDGLFKSDHYKEGDSTEKTATLAAVINKASKAAPKKWFVTCGWCGKHHPSYMCQAKTAKSWMQHACQKCGGLGHPSAVCPSKRKIPSHACPNKGSVFTTFLVNGPFGQSVCNMPSTFDQKSFILDSGAAISVAPHNFMPHVRLNVEDKFEYKLQSASGQNLKVYGSRSIPIRFWKETIYVNFVIC